MEIEEIEGDISDRNRKNNTTSIIQLFYHEHNTKLISRLENQSEPVHLPYEAFGDVILKIDHIPVQVHRVVLSCWSEVFAKMFQSGMAESNAKEIELQEESFEEFMLLLEKLYPPCTKEITLSNVAVFLKYADKYQIHELNRQCEEFLLSQIPSIEVVLIADRFNLHKVFDCQLPWLVNKINEFQNCEEFLMLRKRSLHKIIKAQIENLEHYKDNNEKVIKSLAQISDTIQWRLYSCCGHRAAKFLDENLNPVIQELRGKSSSESKEFSTKEC